MSGPFAELVARLAERAGLTVSGAVEEIPGGRNSRVFFVPTVQKPLLLKQYFRASEQSRNRLAGDFGFAQFAWEHQVRTIPQPIISDDAGQIALFSFVEGRKLAPKEVTVARVEEALAFFQALNTHRDTVGAAELPIAAEGCFSVEEHLKLVNDRVGRLDQTDHAFDAVQRDYNSFVRNQLVPAWNNVQSSAIEDLDEVTGTIPVEQRCLSPSDFGFHNALRTPDDRMVFFDFEYAGWDDPAKTVCDFFCQVQLPVPRNCWSMVVDFVVEILSLPDWHRRRMELLLPVYQVKWCCIMLNEFQQEGTQRRQFAGNADMAQLRDQQLRRVRTYFAEMDLPEAT